VKADTHFPICVGGCGRRGKEVVWYQIADNVRFGECLHCYHERQIRVEKIERTVRKKDPAEWDPPEEPDEETGPEDHQLPWKV
jgi:hypothetical protein